MTVQLSLFPEPPKPRKPPRKLMKPCDAGDAEGGGMIVRFKCNCGYESDWTPVRTTTEAKRGLPCPVCNMFEVALTASGIAYLERADAD